jgi:adenylosuccinate synthase
MRLASIFADASRPGKYETYPPLEFIDRVEQLLRTPITMLSSGPTADHRKERQPEVSEAA